MARRFLKDRGKRNSTNHVHTRFPFNVMEFVESACSAMRRIVVLTGLSADFVVLPPVSVRNVEQITLNLHNTNSGRINISYTSTMKFVTVFALIVASATAFNAPQFATRAVGRTKAVAKKKSFSVRRRRLSLARRTISFPKWPERI